ncbi:MAG: TPM domain-containing protein [Lachnospiraceae bacterium]|nr:TPM domain-containing protein [Lachnospiraceae bacterium]
MSKRMQRKITSITLLLLMLCMAFGMQTDVRADSQDIFINDVSELLTDTEWQTLEERAKELTELYQVAVYVVTLDDFRDYGSTMRDAAENICPDILPGYGEGGDAILLLLSMNERDYWIDDFGEYGSEALTDYGRESLESAMLEHLKSNDWYAGFAAFLDQSEVILKAAAEGNVLDREPLSLGTRIARAYGIALVVGLIAAFIICSRMKAQMKSARRAEAAEEYVAASGVKISVREDRYIETTRTQHKIERSQSSGSTDSGGGGKF